MEHRWGTRWPVAIPLMVDLGCGILERGFVLNISASGLLVRMAAGLKLPLHTPLTILYLEGGPGRHRVHHLEATVVRHSAAGTGLMYPDFNPLQCAALLRLAGDGHAAPRALPGPAADPATTLGAAARRTGDPIRVSSR